ncbi:hypothetical protein A2U01_0039708 [Trifolium medium]|uniref:Uncharacterized protein n=1 Tax=Trifolium medium TaxID=97028 RepID=A0A392Q372_9FABA|nr:hypothetical protein [Trifolium medium]
MVKTTMKIYQIGMTIINFECMTSLAGSGEPPLPPPGGGGDLGGHGSDPPRQGRGRGKKLQPRELKRRVVYNRNLTSMPRRVQEDGTEVPLELDPEEENRVDDKINPIDLLAPTEHLLVDIYGRPVIMPYTNE